MQAESRFPIPSGYERAIRFGARWTMLISPYMILYFILIVLLEGGNSSGDLAAELSFAGSSPIAYEAIAALDGLFHALFFITTVTLFAVLRSAYPVQASLILVALLPPSTGLPRSVRWLGWIMTLGILSPGPGFLLVVLFPHSGYFCWDAG